MAKKKVEEKVDGVQTSVQTPVIRKKAVVEGNRMVPMMSLVNGTVVYKSSRSGAEWIWSAYGEVQDVDYSELQSMLASRPRYLKEPWLIILEDDVIDALNLKNFYDNMVKPEELDTIFQLGATALREKISKAAPGVKELIYVKAKEHIEDLTVGQKKAIEETLDINLEDDLLKNGVE